MLLKKSGLVVSVTVALLLSACGSSSTTGSVGSPSNESFVELAERGVSLATKYESTDQTTDAQMPTVGSATYQGVAAFSDVNNAQYIAENAEIVSNLTLNADFASGTVGGDLTNFRSFDESPISGSVAMSNGSISGGEFTADLNGNVTMGGEAATVDGEMAGAFLGAGAEAVAGGMAADVTSSQSGTQVIYGIFGAER